MYVKCLTINGNAKVKCVLEASITKSQIIVDKLHSVKKYREVVLMSIILFYVGSCFQIPIL